jgi:hypothetical protein
VADTTAKRPNVTVGSGDPLLLVESILADPTSALRLAYLIKARWGDDSAWDSPTVVVPAHLLDPAEYEALLDCGPGNRLITSTVPVAPDLVPAADGTWIVEGWVETWDRPGNGADLEHTIQLAVSDAWRWRGDAGQPVAVTITPPESGRPFGTRLGFSAQANPQPAHTGPPMASWLVGSVDGVEVSRVWWPDQGAPPGMMTIPAGLAAGEHTLTVRYDGVWGLWAPAEASVPFTVAQAVPSATLTIDPTGPVLAKAKVVLRVTHPGTYPLPAASVLVEYAEIGEPDVWEDVGNLPIGASPPGVAGSPPTAVLDHQHIVRRPLLVRLTWVPPDGNWQPAVSNVVAVGVEWGIVAAQHPTWQDVADTRTDWADVAARG